ncbi:MAG: protein translocase subunit SecF [Chloroflexi bacterium]|nr:protein translocase subunit SecF [Chloroflexota bacterium]
MNFVGQRRWFLLLALILVVPGIISLAIPPRLYLGIEFTGGSTISVEFSTLVPVEQLRAKLVELNHPEAIIQKAGDNGYFVRLSTLKAPVGEGAISERQQISDALATLAPLSRYDISSISGVVARDTVRYSFLAVGVALVAILLYMSYSFRKVPKPFRYGTVAVIALIYDALVVIGAFSVLGKAVKLEVNALFIPAILTVLGYAVNDTIVVMDRIRENAARAPDMPLSQVVNNSITETLGRSLITGTSTLIAVLALLLLGGESLRPFLLALFIGIVTGTYTSIGVASQLLVMWELGEIGRLFRRRPRVQASRAEGRA